MDEQLCDDDSDTEGDGGPLGRNSVCGTNFSQTFLVHVSIISSIWLVSQSSLLTAENP